jgi:glycosyltransferase involved in cell wall biosynthesis
MQIAQIAPLTEAIPPKLYGGTERVISWLVDELVALGHDVVLFASGDSQTSANLEACWPKALRLDGAVRDPNALHMAMLEQVRQRAHEFDLLHFHLDYYPFSLFSRQATPFVTTLHGRLDLPEHQVVFATFPQVPMISISNAQRRPVPGASWIRTIHHGLPERLLTPQPVRAAYFAFLGRISPEKAVDQAIWIAKRSGVPLKIAAKVDAVDRDYFESEIRKLLTPPDVEYIGEISDVEKSSFLSGAIALLAPIDWPEPFGLVLIEAMACGTPVIAFNRGSVPEIVEDGLTGFIVEGKEEAVAVTDRLSRLAAAKLLIAALAIHQLRKIPRSGAPSEVNLCSWLCRHIAVSGRCKRKRIASARRRDHFILDRRVSAALRNPREHAPGIGGLSKSCRPDCVLC